MKKETKKKQKIREDINKKRLYRKKIDEGRNEERHHLEGKRQGK